MEYIIRINIKGTASLSILKSEIKFIKSTFDLYYKNKFEKELLKGYTYWKLIENSQPKNRRKKFLIRYLENKLDLEDERKHCYYKFMIDNDLKIHCIHDLSKYELDYKLDVCFIPIL